MVKISSRLDINLEVLVKINSIMLGFVFEVIKSWKEKSWEKREMWLDIIEI